MSQDSLTALLEKEEELLPDLLRYFHNVTFPMIQHPLVYSVPHFSQMNAYVNAQLRQKQESVLKAEMTGNWSSYVFLHERPYRAAAFFNVAKRMNDETYWSLLKHIWIDSENIWQNQDLWLDLLTWNRPGFFKFFMSEEENKVYDSLPDKVTVYRGYNAKRPSSANGLSYTLNPDVAKKFAKRFTSSPAVKTRTISKSQITAYINDRNEEEVIIIP